MKKAFLFFFMAASVALLPHHASAQTLTSEEQQQIQERVRQKVDDFQSSLSRVVNQQLSNTIRDEHQKLIYHLFIGACDPYDYVEFVQNYDGSEKEVSLHSDGAIMQTSSATTKMTSTQKVKEYIRKLRSGMRYSEIKLESADHVKVGTLRKVGNHYECVATITQRFVGYRENRFVYGDITTKKIKCYIIPIEGHDQNYWNVLLSDIYVTDTKRIYNSN